MWMTNVFVSWNNDTFRELLRTDKKKAYEYRLRVLWTPMPDEFLEQELQQPEAKKIDTPEEIMNAVEEDAFEPEEEKVETGVSDNAPQDVAIYTETPTEEEEVEPKNDVVSDIDVGSKEEEPKEEVKPEEEDDPFEDEPNKKPKTKKKK